MTTQEVHVRQAQTAVVCGAVLALAGSAAAQGVRTVSDAGEPIAIVTKVRHTTTVVVPPVETIVDVVAGDAAYWDVSASANVAYVKPLETGVASNVTLVAASGRVWALLVSESADVDPDLVVYIDPPAAGPGTLGRALPPAFTAAAALEAEHAHHADARAALQAVEVAATADLATVRAAHAAEAAAWRTAYPGRMQFPYRLDARARAEPFLVEALWHDGRFTYLRARAQETPALYELTEGEPALVAYELHDDGLYVADHVLGPGRLVIGEVAAPGPRADDRQPKGNPPPRRAPRSGAGARVTRPVTRPPVQDRASQLAALAALGWTGRDAEWIALVCLQSGVFTRSQYGAYFKTGEDRKPAGRFVRALLEKQLAVEDARAVHITQKSIYRALGIPDLRHRRGQEATTQVLMRRLLALDYVIERPTLGWLPTEAEKVQRFEALGIDRGVLPYRTYGEDAKAHKRFVALKCPVAVDEKMATFTYVDPGLTTDSELRAWGVAHAPVWAALRARSFAVHVVAIGTGVGAAQRAEHVLKRWTRDGDGQTETRPAGPTQADPDIRQEIARLVEAISDGNRQRLRAAGGFDTAADRLEWLQRLPEGAPTKEHRRAAIDRYSIWSTIRLVSPEAALC